MADNLLDKASILLTPTAYNDGSMLSVKPENGDGDFTFSRSSAATRVNAQGLVENVQIISSELVSNGNFSQIGTEEVSNGNFSQEGSELITNGGFDTDSGWVTQSGWSISGGTANCDGTANNALRQNFSLPIGTLRIKFDVTARTQGIVNLWINNPAFTQLISADAIGSYEVDVVTTSGANNVFFYSASNFIGSIDNVSVKEVGQDWTLGTGWSIGEDKASRTAQSGSTSMYQSVSFTANKSYKITYDLDISAGSFLLRIGGGALIDTSARTTSGTYTEYIVANSGNNVLNLRAVDGNFIGSITNISVKEVGQDWNLNNGAAIAEDKATIIGDGSIFGYVEQLSTFVSGKKYKVTLDAIINSGGGLVVKYGLAFADNIGSITTSGSYTFYYTAGVSGSIIIGRSVGGVAYNSSITNISVKEITDDTDLPRINYEGFSYQDSLGSEEVVNGTFDSDTSWNKGSGWSIGDGKASKESGVSTYLLQSMVLPTPNTYKVTFTVSDYTSGDVKWGFTSTTASIFGTPRTANGTYTEYFTHDSNTIALRFRASSTFQGSIDNVSVKEYLGQEVVLDSGCGSWLLEPQSTNLVTQSELFSDASWSNTRITITTNTSETLNPSGGNNSELVTQSSTDTNGGAIYKFFSFSATSYTYSIFAKIKDVPFISISETTSAGGTLRRSWFDLQNGTLGSINSAHTAKIESYGNGWYRCSITFTATAGTYSILNYLSNGNNSTTAIVSTGLYIYGAQLEQQSYATSYIPTNGAANTRLQDIATNSGNSTLINSTEGTLYAEFSLLSQDDISDRTIQLHRGSAESCRIRFLNSGSLRWTLIGNDTTIARSLTLTNTNINKVAIRYNSAYASIWINGSLADTANNGMTYTGLDELAFDGFHSKTKAVAVYKEALTDANLRSLTYPNPVATTFDLDFDTIAEQFTFTRGSEATFVNAQGLIESTASNDAPRIDYSTGAKAFLLEPQSTNLITQSELFSDSSWIKLGAGTGNVAIVTDNYAISPDGTQNASRLQCDLNGGVTSSSNQSLIYDVYSSSGNQTISVYLKSNNEQNQTIYLANTQTSGDTITITSEWQRFEFSHNTSPYVFAVGLRGRSGGAIDDTADILIWGAQAEQQSYATSYIPTSGATATRNQELCNNATPVINSEEGTLYLDASALTNGGVDRNISLNDNTSSNHVQLILHATDNRIVFRVNSGGVAQANISDYTFEQTDNLKIACVYKQNNFSLWINGIERATDFSGNIPIGLSKLDFSLFNGTQPFFGNIKGLKYYPKALADVQLQDLTTI